MDNNSDKTVTFIPVRGGSKSIPLKNIKPMAGKPLVQWVLEATSRAACVDSVYVATDDDRIAETVQAMLLPKVQVIGRSPATATDTAATESALLEFCESRSFGHVFLIQATSPLLTAADLQSAWKHYTDSANTSVISVVRQKRFFWEQAAGSGRPLNYDPLRRPRRQEFAGVLVENGAFYLSSREAVLRDRCRLSQPTGLYEMTGASYFEIDEPADWVIVEGLLKQRNKELSLRGQNVRLLAMDCDWVLTDGGCTTARRRGVQEIQHPRWQRDRTAAPGGVQDSGDYRRETPLLSSGGPRNWVSIMC